jgi:uncharacterized protein YqeY
MTFRKSLDRKMVEAAKGQAKIALSALRLIKAALHNREIDLKREATEEEFLQVLSSMVKQRRESIEQFAKGGRTDLVEKEEAELKIIQSFMPAQLSEEEISALIFSAIAEAGAVSVKDMGKVMKILMPKITGRADGETVGERVKASLSA